MPILRILVAFAFMCLNPSSALSQETDKTNISEALARIALLVREGEQTERPWRSLVGASAPLVRQTAFEAIARIRSHQHTNLVLGGLSDTEPAVRTAAVFAWSQMHQVDAGPLRKLLISESEISVLSALAFAFGRTGEAQDIDALRLRLKEANPLLSAVIINAFAELHERGVPIPKDLQDTCVMRYDIAKQSTEKLAILDLIKRLQMPTNEALVKIGQTCLMDQDITVQLQCISNRRLFTDHAEALKKALAHESIMLRRIAVRSLATPAQAETLSEHLAKVGRLTEDTRAWHSQLSAEIPEILDVLMRSQPADATQQKIRDLHQDLGKILQSLRNQEAGASTAEAEGEGVTEEPSSSKAQATPPRTAYLAALHCAASTVLKHWTAKRKHPKCGYGYASHKQSLWWKYRSDALASGGKALNLKRLAADVAAKNVGAKAAFLKKLSEQPASRLRDQFLLAALKPKDSALTRLAVQLIAQVRPKGYQDALLNHYASAAKQRSFWTMAALIDAYARLGMTAAIEIVERHTNDSNLLLKRSAERALTRLQQVMAQQSGPIKVERGRQDRVPPPLMMGGGPKPDLRLIKPSAINLVRFHTSAGPMTVKLYAKQARETVKRFVQLARRDVYNGQPFFGSTMPLITYTGDPTQTGSGGEEPRLRAEVSQRPMTRGAVAMRVLTGGLVGSQIIFSGRRQPVLDGRFPIFGQVTAGLEVLGQLTASDRIIRVELLSQR